MSRSPSPTPLLPKHARVYYATSTCVAERERAALCLSWLSPDERDRHQRFHFERDRLSYLAAHALTREVLSELLALEPGDLRFAVQAHGRPELSFPDLEPRLRFNLSHTHGLVACAVAWAHDIGVDVEHVDRTLELPRIAESVFSDSERAAMFALPAAQQRARFFELWTLKEAYIKAVGKGMSLPLRALNIELDGVRPYLRFSAPLDGDGGRFFFDVKKIAPAHMLAVAVDAEIDKLEVIERLPGG